MELFFEAVGWAGTVALVVAYGVTSLLRKPMGLLYQGLNAGGAIGLIANGALHGAWPSVVLNVVWFTVAAVAIVRLAIARRTAAREGDGSGV